MSLDTLLTQAAFGFDSWKRACRAAATVNVALTGEQTIDGVALAAGDRVLLTQQTSGAQNGPWIVASGAWTRPPEFDASADVPFGCVWQVTSGTSYGGTTWKLTAPTSGIVTLGSTALTIAKDSVSLPNFYPSPIAGDGLSDFVFLYDWQDATSARWVLQGTDIYGHANGYIFGNASTNAGFYFSPGATAHTLSALRSDLATRADLTLNTGLFAIQPSGGMQLRGLTDAERTISGYNVAGTVAARVSLTGADLKLNGDSLYVASQNGTVMCSVTGLGTGSVVNTWSTYCTSITDKIAQVGAGVGVSRSLLVGKGAAGSANGTLTIGAETGNTALGGGTVCQVGSTVGSVSDPFDVRAGSTSLLKVNQSASGNTQVQSDNGITVKSGANGTANYPIYIKAPNGNTALGGKVVVDVGATVSNATDPFAIETNGTRLLSIMQTGSNAIQQRVGNDSMNMVIGGSAGQSGSAFVIIPASYVIVQCSGGYQMISATADIKQYFVAKIRVDGPSNKELYTLQDSVTPTTATSGNVDTHATLTDSLFEVRGDVTVWNSTDGTGMIAKLTTPGLYRNNAGTITTITAAVWTASGDAGETGNVTIGLSFTASTLNITYVTANAKSRTIRSRIEVRHS